MKMSIAKKIALVMAVVLVVGACAGLIVHKTTEGSQSVVKRPISVETETVLESSPLVPVFVTSHSGGGYSVSLCDENGETLDPISSFSHPDSDSYNGFRFPMIGYSDFYLVPVGSIIHYSGSSGAKPGNRWWVDVLFPDGDTYENQPSYIPTDYIIPEDSVLVIVQFGLYSN